MARTNVREDFRRRATYTVVVGAWVGTIVGSYLRATDTIEIHWNSVIVTLMGVAIAATMALSRMRLASTISGVFDAGLKVATAMQANVTKRAALIEADYDGVIICADNAPVIHWNRDDLVGRQLEAIIPERYREAHHKGMEAFKEQGQTRVVGSTIFVPVVGQDGVEYPMQLTVARLGNSFLGTLVPLNSSNEVSI